MPEWVAWTLYTVLMAALAIALFKNNGGGKKEG
jgi:hypothetical protein